MSPAVAFCSFRLGGGDGVSIVARTWMDVMTAWGCDVITVTGAEAGHDPYPHRRVPGLGLERTLDTDDIIGPLAQALADVDLVVVENLLTIPLNLAASSAVRLVLAGRPAIVHHHDPPWHRARFAHIDSLPVDDPAWRHVAITHLLADEMRSRGFTVETIHNAFTAPVDRDAQALAELRNATRESVGLHPDATVVAHPVRAIERKNIPAAITLAERLGATYWLLGAAEEGYGDELARLIAKAGCPVVHQSCFDVDGIYAAADHIAFPSTWEGFGNPPFEAALRRRGVSVGTYPVSEEFRAMGFEWFDPADVAAIEHSIYEAASDDVVAMLDRNERLVRQGFSIEGLERSLRQLVDEAGWW